MTAYVPRQESLWIRFEDDSDRQLISWSPTGDGASVLIAHYPTPMISDGGKPRRQGLELFRSLPPELQELLRTKAAPDAVTGLSRQLLLRIEGEQHINAITLPWESLAIDTEDGYGDPSYLLEPIIEGRWALSIGLHPQKCEHPARPCAHLHVAIALGNLRQPLTSAPALGDAAELVRRMLMTEHANGKNAASVRFAAHPRLASGVSEMLDNATAALFRSRLTEIETKKRVVEFAREASVFCFVGHSDTDPIDGQARGLDFVGFKMGVDELAEGLAAARATAEGGPDLSIIAACNSRVGFVAPLLASVPDLIATYGMASPAAVARVAVAIVAELASGASIPLALAAARTNCLCEVEPADIRMFRHWTTRREHAPLFSPLAAYAEDLADRLGSVKVYTAKGGRKQVRLETIHLALKADPTPLHERERSILAWRRAVSDDLRIAHYLRSSEQLEGWPDLEDLPAARRREHLVEAARMLATSADDESKSITLAQAYLQNHSFVILGDPGSGKSTSLRWLAVTMSKAIARGRASTDSTDETPALPARLPVWVECTEFERFLSRCEDDQVEATIDRFVRENWRSKDSAAHILDWVAAGKALFLFDGLDEVLTGASRRRIVESVHRYLGLDRISSRRDFETVAGGPNVDRGNRVVLSCRIVGDYTAEVDAELPRFTIEPLSLDDIPKFLTRWFLSVLEPAHESDANAKATALYQELQKPHNKQLMDAAGNPQIAAVLASVWYAEGQAARAESDRLERPIYLTFERCARHMLKDYVDKLGDDFPQAIRQRETFDLLGSLAARMHEISGPLPEADLTRTIEEWCTKESSWPALRYKIAMHGLIHVRSGLLTTFSSDGIKFLHRRFQEFFVARWLIENGLLAQQFVQRRMDPAWRPVLTMALEGLSVHPGHAAEIIPLLDEWIAAEAATHNVLIPIGLQIVVRALPNLGGGAHVREVVATKTANALVGALCRFQAAMQIPELRKTLEDLLRRLSEAGHRGAVINEFEAALAMPENGPRLARSIAALELTGDLGGALRSTLPLDSAPDFPINRTLRSGSSVNPARGLPAADPLQPDDGARTRRLLLLTRGGLGDLATCESRRRYFELVNFLSLDDSLRDPIAPMLNKRWSHELRIRRNNDEDAVYEIAVFLDTVGRRHWKTIPEWANNRCYLVSSAILGASTDLDYHHAQELDLIAASPSRRQRREVVQRHRESASFLAELRQQYESLKDPVARTIHSLGEALAHLRGVLEASLMEAVTLGCIRFANLCCSPLDLQLSQHALSPRLAAEIAALKLRGSGDDPAKSAATYLETMDAWPERFVSAIHLAGEAQNRNALLAATEWPAVTMPPRAHRPGDLPIDVLRSLDAIGGDFGGCRELALELASKTPGLEPGLRIEVAALALASRSNVVAGWEVAVDLVPEIADVADPVQTLVELAAAIPSGFVRARARTRLLALQHDQVHRDDLWQSVLSDLEGLTQPAILHEALELAAVSALRYYPSTALAHEIDLLIDAAQRIPDADDRARAIARSAMFFPRERRPILLAEAALVAATIESPLDRASALAALAPCRAYPLSDNAWHRAHATLGEDWTADLASGHFGSLLRTCDARFDTCAPEIAFRWQTITSFGLLADALHDAGADESHETLWLRLRQEPKSVLAQFHERQTERIRLTTTAALVLDDLLDTEPGIACELLAMASIPDPETLPLLWAWTERDTPGLASVAALLIVELVGLSPRLVHPVTALLRGSNRDTHANSRDHLEARAGRAIHHPTEHIGGCTSARALGLDTLREIMKARDTLDARGRLRVHWLFNTLYVADASTIQLWLGCIERGQDSHLMVALGYLRFASDAVFEFLLQHAEQAEFLDFDEATALLRTWHASEGRHTAGTAERVAACCARTARPFLLPRLNHEDLLEWVRQRASPDFAGDHDLVTALAPVETIVKDGGPNALLEAVGGMYTSNDGLSAARATRPILTLIDIETLLGATDKTLARLRRSLNAPLPELIVASMAVELAAAAAELQPIGFRIAFQGMERRKQYLELLRWAASSMPSFPGRCGALILLGTFDDATSETVGVLCDAVNDVDPVRAAALLAADMLAQPAPGVLEKLSGIVQGAHPLEAHAAARILGAIGRNQVQPALCAHVVSALLHAATMPSRHRHVLANPRRIRIPDLPKLDELLYEIAQRTAGY